jgi:hypothetical protein
MWNARYPCTTRILCLVASSHPGLQSPCRVPNGKGLVLLRRLAHDYTYEPISKQPFCPEHHFQLWRKTPRWSFLGSFDHEWAVNCRVALRILSLPRVGFRQLVLLAMNFSYQIAAPLVMASTRSSSSSHSEWENNYPFSLRYSILIIPHRLNFDFVVRTA